MIFQPSSVKMDDKSKNFFIYSIALILLFYGVSVGINITSFSLFLHQMGVPKSQVADITTMEMLGSLIAAPLFPRLCERYGAFLILVGSLILRSIASVAFPMTSILKLNMIWLLASGLGSFCALTALWFWAASLVRDGSRARMIAIISVAFSAGIAMGVGTIFYKANKMPLDLFKTSALLSSIIILPIYFIREACPKLPIRAQYNPPSKLVKYMMIPIISILAANYLLFSLNHFGVVYSIKNNVPYNVAILTNIYMLCGNFILTIPAAFILDKMKVKVSFLSIILAAICTTTLLIPFTISMPYAPIILFGTLSSLISLVLVYSISQVSTKFRDHNLLAAISMLSIMHTIGGFAGIATTKASVEYWGNQGMIISIGVVALFVLLYVINFASEGE